MTTGISGSFYYSGSVRSTNVSGKTTEAKSTDKASSGIKSSLKKPSWNPNQVFDYLEDMDAGFKSYRSQAETYYTSAVAEEEGDGVLTVDELKAQIKEWFPEYTLTDSEPKNVVQGIYYLYIDDNQLEKMASDASYRAKVYALMDTELQGIKGYTLKYSDGRNVTSHLTGSIFSLAQANSKYAGADGIPYHGSCTSDHPFSSSKSHAQVRSMSYLYDNFDPIKSAAKDRAKARQKKSLAAKAEAKKLAAKKAKKKKEEEKLEKKAEEKDSLQDMMQGMTSCSKYKSADDIEVLDEDEQKKEKESENYGGSVTFNEAKRARQLAAAKTADNVRTVMTLLAKDLTDCQNGLEQGMCDENEVAKVKAMISKANQRMAEVSGTKQDAEDKSGFDEFSISMLM